MRKFILLITSSALLALGIAFGGGSALASNGNACPHASNTPPNCGNHNGQGHGGGGGGTTCDFANPPTGPISGIVGQVGEGVGDNPLGNLVVDVGCALQNDLGL